MVSPVDFVLVSCEQITSEDLGCSDSHIRARESGRLSETAGARVPFVGSGGDAVEHVGFWVEAGAERDPLEEAALRTSFEGSSLKRLAWAFGCAKKGSGKEAVLRELLVDRISGGES